MKAIAAPSYGPLESLALIDAPLPVPRAGEVRVRVVASALNPADFKVILGTLKFLHARNRPLIVGYDFSGTVEAVGPRVAAFSVGSEVFGFLPYGPGNRRGAFAESLIAKCDEIAMKPARVSHETAAAAATTGITALQSIRDLGRLPGSGGELLVTGVSGGVGSISVGIGRKLNARVTAVGSGAGLELARRLGAVEALDRTKGQLPGGIRDRFDVVFDAAAAYRWRDWRGTLKPGGAFVTTLPSLAFAVDKNPQPLFGHARSLRQCEVARRRPRASGVVARSGARGTVGLGHPGTGRREGPRRPSEVGRPDRRAGRGRILRGRRIVTQTPANFAEAREQFLAIVDGVRPELHRYCARLTGSVIEGEDIVQETLAKAFYALSLSAEVPPLRPWLFRIAHNAAHRFPEEPRPEVHRRARRDRGDRGLRGQARSGASSAPRSRAFSRSR